MEIKYLNLFNIIIILEIKVLIIVKLVQIKVIVIHVKIIMG